MYEAYFGLTERPFSIAPDPQYLYMSSRHKEAMAHLSYGLLQGGCFIVLTGEVGTGKTTLCRNLLVELPDNVDVALVLNANINELELLQTVCDELQIDYQQKHSQKQLLDRINTHLLTSYADGRHTVLIIDEAQLLSRDVLEQIRLLTNLETTKAKLLQIILIGQPELNEVLSRNDLRQLAQRVTARYHLGELKRSEIEEYVNFRLGVAGCKQPLFSRQALTRLHQLTDGIPRKINVLADHALLAAYADNMRVIDARTVQTAARDVFISSTQKASLPGWLRGVSGWPKTAALVFALVLLNMLLWWWFTAPDKPVSTAASDRPGLSEQAAVSERAQVDAVTQSEVAVSELVVAEVAESAAPAEQLEAPTEPGAESNVTEQIAGQVVDAPESAPADSVPAETSADDSAGIEIVGTNSLPGTVVISEQFLDASTSIPAELSTEADGEGIALDQPADAALGTVSPAPGLSLQTRFGDALETAADLTGRISAFRALAAQWGEQLPDQMLRPACTEVASTGLQCLSFDNWQQLRRSNRPAILVVSHDDQLHRILVEAISDTFASVALGDRTYTVPVDELQARWNRSGVLFWRPAADAQGLLQLNDAGDKVIAARGYLNRALATSGLPLLRSIDQPLFDLDMSQKVFALQTRFGLSGDSMIGSQTWMLINELIFPEQTPVLRSRLADNAVDRAVQE